MIHTTRKKNRVQYYRLHFCINKRFGQGYRSGQGGVIKDLRRALYSLLHNTIFAQDDIYDRLYRVCVFI